MTDTRGQLALRALEHTSADIALRCGVTRAAVDSWRQGKRKPTTEVRAALCVHYGIPAINWDRAPVDPDVEPAADLDESVPADDVVATLIAEIKRLQQLRSEDLDTTAKVKISLAIASVSSDLRQAQAVSSARQAHFVQSREWATFSGLFVAQVKHSPELLAAVIVALENIPGGVVQHDPHEPAETTALLDKARAAHSARSR